MTLLFDVIQVQIMCIKQYVYVHIYIVFESHIWLFRIVFW